MKRGRVVWFLSAAVFGLAWGLCLWLAAPDLYWGDNPELTAASRELGVAHSPGYPIFLQAGHLLGAVPLEGHPFRLNAAAAFLLALSLAGLYAAASSLIAAPWLALAAPALLMTSNAALQTGLFWDVYSLHFLLLSTVLLGAARLAAGKDFRTAALLFFALAAGCANHILMQLVFIAGLVFWAFQPFGGKRRALPAFLFLSALSAAFFLALPLCAAREPYMNWWNPQTPSNFLSLVLMRGYLATWPGGLFAFASRLNAVGILKEINPGFAAVAAAGVLVGLKDMRNARLFALLALAVSFVSTGLIAQHDKPDTLRVQLYYFFAFFAAGGLAWFYAFALKAARVLRPAAFFLTVLTSAVLLHWNLEDGLPLCFRTNRDVERYARMFVDPLPEKSLLLMASPVGGDFSEGILPYYEAASRWDGAGVLKPGVAMVRATFLGFDWETEALRRRYPGLHIPDARWEKGDGPQTFTINSPPVRRALMEIIELNWARGWTIFTTFPLEEGFSLVSIPQKFAYTVLDFREFVASDEGKRKAMELIKKDVTPSVTEWSLCDPLTLEIVGSILNERGRVYGAIDQPAMAISQFERALNMNPNFCLALSNKGAVLQRLPGGWKKGVESIVQAREMCPHKPELLYNHADALYRGFEGAPDADEVLKTLEKAEADLLEAEKRGLKTAELYNLLGAVHHAAYKLEEMMGKGNPARLRGAVDSFLKALDVNPEAFRPYCNLGGVMKEMNQCDAAVDNLRRCAELAPWNVQGRIDHIAALGACGQAERSREEFRRLLREFPDHPLVKDALDRLQSSRWRGEKEM